MPQINGGQALIESLYREGVRLVMGLPGAGQYEAIDALYERPDIRYISLRHEQAASYMADGYARVSGKVGVGLVVEGPGFFNTLAGLSTAAAVSSPVLMVTGDDHTAPDPSRTNFDGLASHLAYAKWAGRAQNPARVPGLVREAFRQLHTGRPAPVVVEVGPAVMGMREEVTFFEPETQPSRAAEGDDETMELAAQLLTQAERPLIWAGSGAVYSDAAPIVRALAEFLKAPVVTSRTGKGILSDRHPLSLGMANMGFKPLKEWTDRRDVILAVGVRGGFGTPGAHQKVIRIDIEPQTATSGAPECAITGDAKICLEGLYRRVAALRTPRPNLPEELAGINAKRFGPEEQLQPQADLIRAIRNALPDEGIVVPGMNQMGYYSRNYYPAYAPKTYLTTSSMGTLGSAYPIALGAKLGRPDQPVVSISGDGGFLYNAQEMATAVQYGINAIAVVFNDNAYGNVLRNQIENQGGHVLGTRLYNPDFVRLGESFGMLSLRANNAEQLEAALRRAIQADKPALIEVPVPMMRRRY